MTVRASLTRALRRPRFCVFSRPPLALALCLALTACFGGVPTPEQRRDGAHALAEEAAFTPRRIDVGALTLQSFHRGEAPVLTVYIEGDGYAWRSARRPSADPTPISPLALKLAFEDPAPAVAYLARPCQYGAEDAACATNDLWTSARFSEAVIAASDAAIDALMATAGAERVRLVGYSGGAAVAVLVAARRTDVASLETVAGYLDPTGLNAARGVSALSGSLDPIAAAAALRGLPQSHYAGGRDRVIPSASIAVFVEAVGDPACARMVVLPLATHHERWRAFWPGRAAPSCDG